MWFEPSVRAGTVLEIDLGRDREYGFAASRARRATRPTPEQISASVCGTVPTSACRRACWGIARRPLRPALTRSPRSSLGTRSGVGRDADRIERYGRGAQGTTESSADARDPMTRLTKRAIASSRAGASRPFDRGRPSAAISGQVGSHSRAPSAIKATALLDQRMGWDWFEALTAFSPVPQPRSPGPSTPGAARCG